MQIGTNTRVHTRTHTHTHWMGMNIMGHFTFPPFSLSFPFAPSFHNLSLSFSPPPPALSISLFLSVKVMQLIFLCLFIFQDWLWNVGSRQKPHRPLPFPPSLSSPLLQPPPLASLSTGPRPIQKLSDGGGSGGMQPSLHLLFLPALLSFLSSFSLYSFYICPFPLLLRPLLPFSWISDHIPLTELKSCITLKTLPMHCG